PAAAHRPRGWPGCPGETIPRASPLTPFRAQGVALARVPRALPWAIILRPFGAPAREAPKGRNWIVQGNALVSTRGAGGLRGDEARGKIEGERSTTQVLLPPKPKELDTVTFTRAWRAWCGTWHRSHSGSGSSRLMVGGRAP